jgi:putative transport protein
VVAVVVHYLFGFSKAVTTGIYSGSSTNTTALAAVTESVNTNTQVGMKSVKDLVIGYTYSYPMGVLGVMIVLKLFEKFLKVDYQLELNAIRRDYPIEEELMSGSVKITNPLVNGVSIRDLMQEKDWDLIFGRIKQGEYISLTTYDTELRSGDIINIIGSIDDFKDVVNYLGEQTDDNHLYNSNEYEVKRIFVSNQDVVGKTLASLNLAEKFSAVVTRIRRGDIDMLAKPETILEQGDRIRFVARKKDLKALSKFFGDSYYESSRVNLFSFGLGIALGLLLGTFTVELGNGLSFSLGYSGGPLIIGLILGALRRTGPIVWTLPYSANVTLRQLGLIFLLAVIGIQSGHGFLQSMNSDGAIIFLGGTIVSMFTAALSIYIGYVIYKIPFSMLLGFLSNQPAILDYANNMAKNKAPLIGYTIMFPISLIIKIVYAQVLYFLLR